MLNTLHEGGAQYSATPPRRAHFTCVMLHAACSVFIISCVYVHTIRISGFLSLPLTMQNVCAVLKLGAKHTINTRPSCDVNL